MFRVLYSESGFIIFRVAPVVVCNIHLVYGMLVYVCMFSEKVKEPMTMVKVLHNMQLKSPQEVNPFVSPQMYSFPHLAHLCRHLPCGVQVCEGDSIDPDPFQQAQLHQGFERILSHPHYGGRRSPGPGHQVLRAGGKNPIPGAAAQRFTGQGSEVQALHHLHWGTRR